MIKLIFKFAIITFSFWCMPAFAVMDLFVCGSSTYVCPPDPGLPSPGTNVGPDIQITDPGSGDVVDIPLSSAPEDAIPPPSAPSTSPGIPVYSYQASFSSFSGSGPTAQDACNALVASIYGAGQTGTATETTCELGHDCTGSCTGTTTKTPTGEITCPTGYVNSGGVCTLSDPRAVTPDGAVDANREPSAGNPDALSPASSNDPDSSSITINPVYTAPNNAQFVGYDANGQWNYIDVTTQSGGGTVVTEHTQVSDAFGNTGVQTSVINIGSDGTVNSVSQSTAAGSISMNTSGGSTTGSTSSAPAGSQFGGGAGGGSAPVVFPSDYARTGEAATAAQSIVDNLDGHLNPTDTVDDPLEPSAADAPGFSTTFDGLKNWTVPTHSSTCPQPSMDLSMVLGAGHVYTMSAHCQLVQDNFATLRAAMLVCWSIAALFVVLRA